MAKKMVKCTVTWCDTNIGQRNPKTGKWAPWTAKQFKDMIDMVIPDDAIVVLGTDYGNPIIEFMWEREPHEPTMKITEANIWNEDNDNEK